MVLPALCRLSDINLKSKIGFSREKWQSWCPQWGGHTRKRKLCVALKSSVLFLTGLKRVYNGTSSLLQNTNSGWQLYKHQWLDSVQKQIDLARKYLIAVPSAVRQRARHGKSDISAAPWKHHFSSAQAFSRLVPIAFRFSFFCMGGKHEKSGWQPK